MGRPWLEQAMALAIAGIAGAVLAFSIRVPGWLGSPNAPAWVKAVGALVAIGATIALARSDKRATIEKERREARSAAIAFFPELVEVITQLQFGIGQVANGSKPENIGNDGPNEDDVIRFWQLPILPPTLEALRSLLKDLGSASEPTQRAYFALQRLRENFRDFARTKEFDGPVEMWVYEPEEWTTTLALAKQAQASAERALGAVSKLLK